MCIAEDADSLEEHKKAIAAEVGKAKSRHSVLLPLMKSTYAEQRMFILNEATSVAVILTNHPALSRPTYTIVRPSYTFSPYVYNRKTILHFLALRI